MAPCPETAMKTAPHMVCVTLEKNGSQSVGIFRQQLKDMLSYTLSKNRTIWKLQSTFELGWLLSPDVWLSCWWAQHIPCTYGGLVWEIVSIPWLLPLPHNNLLEFSTAKDSSLWPMFYMETYPEEELLLGDLCSFFSALGSKSACPLSLPSEKKRKTFI